MPPNGGRVACFNRYLRISATNSERRGMAMRAGSRVPELVAGSIVKEPITHCLFGRKRLRVGFAEVVATFDPSCPMIIRSLMIGIDQGVIAECEETFGESIDGVLLCDAEHLLGSFPAFRVA
jgi:hypothetical protein